MTHKTEKQQLRTEIAACVKALSPEERTGYDQTICKRLSDWIDAHPTAISGGVAAYMPLADEVNLLPWIQNLPGKGVALWLPRVENGCLCWKQCSGSMIDCAPGAYGILEPCGETEPHLPESVSLVIVPGRAFDRCGQRLGRGGGYYDQLGCSKATRLAVCYPEQLVDHVPCDAHDKPVDWILTPEHTLGPLQGEI